MMELSTINLLLQSVRHVDEQIKELREQLNSLYEYRRVLVDQLAVEADAVGLEQGYSDGEYRYKRVVSYKAIDPQGVASVAPHIVRQETVWKVDGRQLDQLMRTSLAEQLKPYVREEITHEVVPETRKTVKRAMQATGVPSSEPDPFSD